MSLQEFIETNRLVYGVLPKISSIDFGDGYLGFNDLTDFSYLFKDNPFNRFLFTVEPSILYFEFETSSIVPTETKLFCNRIVNLGKLKRYIEDVSNNRDEIVSFKLRVQSYCPSFEEFGSEVSGFFEDDSNKGILELTFPTDFYKRIYRPSVSSVYLIEYDQTVKIW